VSYLPLLHANHKHTTVSEMTLHTNIEVTDSPGTQFRIFRLFPVLSVISM